MTRSRDMANLGSQAGSGLDASDITSGVLPSGVTGGSGLTALGTVTSANLANANIVYPAGHVDYFGHSILPAAGGNHSSTGFSTHGGVAVTVPAVTCNAMSHLTIIFNLFCYVAYGSSHTDIGIRGDRSVPSGVNYQEQTIGADDESSSTHRLQATYIIYDDSLSNANRTYRIQSRKGWGSGVSAGVMAINAYGTNILVIGKK